MHVNIKCKVSLSKKLRKILESSNVTLTTDSLINGVGMGNLSLSADESKFDESLLNTATSIEITPIEITEGIPDPTINRVGSIFQTVPQKGEESKLVNKLGAVNPPEYEEVPTAIKTKEETTPKEFEFTQDQGYQDFIGNFSELMEEVNKTKSRIEGGDIEKIDTSSIIHPRERAMAVAENESREAITKPAFICNDSAANISINDLDISLKNGEVCNISEISAMKLAKSTDIKMLLNNGLIKFVSPEEALKRQNMLLQQGTVQKVGLEAYSGPSASKMAEKAFREGDDEILIVEGEGGYEISMDDEDDVVDEEEADFVNLVNNFENKNAGMSGKTRVTKSLSNKNSRKKLPAKKKMPSESGGGAIAVRRT